MTQTTRAAQRDATRQAIVDAAVECLITSGYSAVRTRQIARAAGVAQGTVTYHFDSREALLTEAVSQVIERLVESARRMVGDLGREEITIERSLDTLWDTVTTTEGLAVAHLWYATWSEPQLIPVVRAHEARIFEATAAGFSHAFSGETRRLVFIDMVLSVMRGLVQSIPVHGLEFVETRWRLSKSALLAAARSATSANFAIDGLPAV